MPDKENKKNNILQEHFWFTATTLAVNGFLMSDTIWNKHPCTARTVSIIISLYAAYLIIQRSLAAAGKIKFPKKLKDIKPDKKTFLHKACETWYILTKVPGHLPFVVCELSGSFFYLLLVLASCGGVWLIR